MFEVKALTIEKLKELYGDRKIDTKGHVIEDQFCCEVCSSYFFESEGVNTDFNTQCDKCINGGD